VQSEDAVMKGTRSWKSGSCSSLYKNEQISNFSEKLVLPYFVDRNQPEFASISAETLVNLIDNQLGIEIDQFYIIDTRFPFEHEGGHIRGSINMNIDQIEDFFFRDKKYLQKKKNGYYISL